MSRSDRLLLLVPVALSAVVFYPITRNFFHADDFQHLYALADGRLLEFLVTPHGGHLLVVRNLLFALTHWLAGVDPTGYMACALATHLLNVGLLFRLLRRATDSPWLACFGATLWGISPLDEESLGWYSVYGQVVLTTAMLWVWGETVGAARAGTAPSRRRLLAWYAAVVAGSACFGIGVGIALAFVPAIWLLLPGAAQRRVHWTFATLALVVPALYVLVQWLYVLVVGHAHESVTMARETAASISLVAPMGVSLVAFGLGRTLLDHLVDAAVAYPGPEVIAAAAAAAAVVLGGLLVGAPALRRQLCAGLLLAGGAYGIIAVGRAPLLPGLAMSPITAATWARYHYTATAVLVVVVCLGLHGLAVWRQVSERGAQVALRWWLLLTVAGLLRHSPVIEHYDDEREQVAHMREVVHKRVEETPRGELVYIQNRPLLPLAYLISDELFPGWAGLFVILYPDNIVDGRPVLFVSGDPAGVAAALARRGTRTAGLLVTQAEFRERLGLPPLPEGGEYDADADAPERGPGTLDRQAPRGDDDAEQGEGVGGDAEAGAAADDDGEHPLAPGVT